MSYCLFVPGGHRQRSRGGDEKVGTERLTRVVFPSLGERWVCEMDRHHVGEILLSVWNDCLFVLLAELPLTPVGLMERVLNGKPGATVIQRWAICPITWRKFYELFNQVALHWYQNSSKMTQLYSHLVPLCYRNTTALGFFCTLSGMWGLQDCEGLTP